MAKTMQENYDMMLQMVQHSSAEAQLDRMQTDLDQCSQDIVDTRKLLDDNMGQCKDALMAHKSLVEQMQSQLCTYAIDDLKGNVLDLQSRFTQFQTASTSFQKEMTDRFCTVDNLIKKSSPPTSADSAAVVGVPSLSLSLQMWFDGQIHTLSLLDHDLNLIHFLKLLVKMLSLHNQGSCRSSKNCSKPLLVGTQCLRLNPTQVLVVPAPQLKATLTLSTGR